MPKNGKLCMEKWNGLKYNYKKIQITKHELYVILGNDYWKTQQISFTLTIQKYILWFNNWSFPRRMDHHCTNWKMYMLKLMQTMVC